jgi:hypothetical protein
MKLESSQPSLWTGAGSARAGCHPPKSVSPASASPVGTPGIAGAPPHAQRSVRPKVASIRQARIYKTRVTEAPSIGFHSIFRAWERR